MPLRLLEEGRRERGQGCEGTGAAWSWVRVRKGQGGEQGEEGPVSDREERREELGEGHEEGRGRGREVARSGGRLIVLLKAEKGEERGGGESAWIRLKLASASERLLKFLSGWNLMASFLYA